ncbi:hypothetical protein RBSWK_03869 [Rhodopirellula baltica SWK14]|uniref:Uncharacterized protein n=1 Tax=Rhodopirellula baltica SWK14 TaxID=993516 RepID=L7CE92_RHOBT|nr:hypothetical protein RBSWK_03869 [Rhodopirellula baltica SWK14]
MSRAEPCETDAESPGLAKTQINGADASVSVRRTGWITLQRDNRRKSSFPLSTFGFAVDIFRSRLKNSERAITFQ